MRRTTALTLTCLVILVTASCTTGDDDTDLSDLTSTESASSGEAGAAIEDGSSTEPTEPTSGDDADLPPALPGLLDSSDEPIGNDAAVRTGTLPNGLEYYVRENDNPGSKATLKLAIRAGSVDELGPTTGVAHFVEHMLFNGTERFPKNELIDVLRSFGAEFGADVNAYTSFDETVYELTVPNDDDTIDTGLTVLEQWLSHATLDPDQVVSERGVVADEWRVRTQRVEGRLYEVAQDLYLTGSAYEDRSPIGTSDSIEAMATDELREFYDTWYRPDNAAVVAVGDFDADTIVAAIEELFGPTEPRAASMPERPDVTFALETEPAFGLHADPDQQTVDVEVTLPLPADTGNGTANWRSTMLDQVAYDALIRRLDQDVAAGTAAFDRIGPGSNSFVGTLDAPALYAFTDAERVDATLEALLDEYERADRFGFSDEEVEVAKDTLRAQYDTFLAGSESAQDADYAVDYVAHFLTGSPYPSIADEYDVLTSILDGITAEAVDLRFRARWANTAPHVIISTPESQADQMPSETEVLGVITALADRELAARDGQAELPDALMSPPEPVAPVTTESVLPVGGSDPLDPIAMTFENGVRVIVNSNTIVEGQVFFQASSPGGSSLVDDADVVDALYAADVVTTSGVADFNQVQVDQILAGTDVSVDAWITPYLDNFAGSAATADAEALFQLLHLYMVEPRFDPVALSQVERSEGPLVDDPSTDPGAAGYDALVEARYGGELRYDVVPTPDEFATLDLDGVERVWRDRFGDASDWVFVFSGDVDVDEITDLASAYLGTLPGSGVTEEWVDVEAPPPPGVVTRTVTAGTGDTASVTFLFTSPVDEVDGRLRATADVVTKVLDARLTDTIREEFGESYSPRAVSAVTTDPDPAIETYVIVTGAPDRIEAVTQLVTSELADLQSGGLSGQEFDNAFAQVDEEYGFVNNGQFITELLDDAVQPALELVDYFGQFVELESVTAATVEEYLRDHAPIDRFVQVIVVPR